MSMQIRCTHCQVSIKVAETLRGKSIRCPSCQQVTKVLAKTQVTRGDEIMEQGPARIAPRANPRPTRVAGEEARRPMPPPRRRDFEDDRMRDDDRPSPRNRDHGARSGSSVGFWIATTFIVLFLMSGVAAGTYWLTRQTSEPAPQANNSRSNDDAIARLKKENKDLKKSLEEAAAARKPGDNDKKPAEVTPQNAETPLDPALAKKKADDEAKKTDDEALAKRRAEDEAYRAKRKADEEAAAKKKIDDDVLAKKKIEDDILAKKVADDLAKKKIEDDILAKKMADDLAAKKKADDDALAKNTGDALAAKKKADDDALARKMADDLAAKKKADDDAIAARKKADDDAIARKMAEDQAARKTADPPPAVVAYQPVPIPPGPAPAKIAPDTTRKVKKATAYIRVTDSTGLKASGSGFFAMEPGIVVTNAHVVGMLSPSAGPPKKLEIIMNSGTPDEKVFDAIVLGADRENDLAIVRLQTGDTSKLPAPLPVELDGCSLEELQDIFIFGFPLGEQLGKEITVRPSSVSSFRRDVDGSLFQIQVNGGMDPGNSGGPVVDTRGVVVGVSVAGIRGTQINFAVPSEKIQGMLHGRVQETYVGLAFRDQTAVKLPVKLICLDPLQRVQQLSLDIWTGPAGKMRPGSLTPPANVPGDGAKRNVLVNYQFGKANHDIELPTLDLPAGHVVWIQPVLVSSTGVKQWAATTSVKPADLAPLERIPVNLTYSTRSSERSIDLAGKFEDQIQNGKKKIIFSDDLKFQVLEEMTNEPNGTSLRVVMGKGEFSETIPNKEGKSATKPRDTKAQDLVRRKIFTYSTDVFGKLEKFGFPQFRPSNPNPKIIVGKGKNPKSPPPPVFSIEKEIMYMEAEDMASMFNTCYQLSSLNLPNREVKPMEVWDTRTAVLVGTGRGKKTQLDLFLKYTYEGSRTVNGKTEALISVIGQVEKHKTTKEDQKDKEEGGHRPKSKVRGQGTFDVAGGFFKKLKIAIISEGEDASFILEVNLTRELGNVNNIGPLPPRNGGPVVATELQGIWELVSAKWNGIDDMNRFGKTLTINNADYTIVNPNGQQERGTVILNTTKFPKEMLMQQGGSQRGTIYHLQGDQLTICFALNGPTPKTFDLPGNAVLVYKRTGMPASNPGPKPGPGPGPGPSGPVAGETRLVGGGVKDPVERDQAPPDAFLVGFEVGMGNGDVVKMVRPIYRSAKGETYGTPHGGNGVKKTASAKAKDGYAVGKVKAKVGLTVDGFSMTFMRIKDGKLDPNDSYESPWLGGPGGNRFEELGGGGTPVVGVVARVPRNEFVGLGLILKTAGASPGPGAGAAQPSPATAGMGATPPAASSPAAASLALRSEVPVSSAITEACAAAAEPSWLLICLEDHRNLVVGFAVTDWPATKQ